MTAYCLFMAAKFFLLSLLVQAPVVFAQSGVSEKMSLDRPPTPGETAYYRIVRTDETLDAQGRVTGRTHSSGLFLRETLYVGADGTRTDRYTWKSFSTGRTDGSSDSVRMTAVAAVTGFSFDLSSGDRLSVPALAVGGMAKTTETFVFFTVVWDAVALFRNAAARPGYPIGQLEHIDDRIEETTVPAPAVFDFTPVVSRFSYVRGTTTTELAGFGPVNGVPCVLLRFETRPGPITYLYRTERQTIEIRGTERSEGSIRMATDRPVVLQGEMTGLLVAMQTGTLPGKTVETPIVIRQKTRMERVSAESLD